MIIYRLRLIDKDGHFTYSKIIRFDITQTTGSMQVFPVPAVHSLNLSFTQTTRGMVVIRITDLKGATVLKQSVNIDMGRASMSIDVSALSSASYILSVTNATGTMQQKFIKQ
jgi:hypothetical protein